MRKKLWSIAICAVLMFAGCGLKPASEPTEAKTTLSAAVTQKETTKQETTAPETTTKEETTAAPATTALAPEVTQKTLNHYTLNTSTKKIHKDSCASAAQIKDSNLGEWEGESVEEFLASHSKYSACKKCNPK